MPKLIPNQIKQSSGSELVVEKKNNDLFVVHIILI
jgi:hypothetical protein